MTSRNLRFSSCSLKLDDLGVVGDESSELIEEPCDSLSICKNGFVSSFYALPKRRGGPSCLTGEVILLEMLPRCERSSFRGDELN